METVHLKQKCHSTLSHSKRKQKQHGDMTYRQLYDRK